MRRNRTLIEALREAPAEPLTVGGATDRWHLAHTPLDNASMRQLGYFRTWRVFSAAHKIMVRDCVLHYPRDVFTQAAQIPPDSPTDPPGFLLYLR